MPSRFRHVLTPALAVAAAALLTACGAVTGTGDPSAAAVVGDAEIPLSILERQFETVEQNPQVSQQLEGDDEGVAAKRIQAQILTFLIRAELLEQGAQDLGVEVTDQDIADKRDEIIEQFGGKEAFEAAIEENNLAAEDVDAQIRSLTYEDAIREALTEDAEIRDEDIRAAYEQQYGGDGVRARHVLVETEQEAQQVRTRLDSGEDFEQVAREVSTDPSAQQNGGDLGPVARGQTVPAFEKALFAAEPGELVGPVETQFGWHVIERLEPPPLADVRDELRDQLLSRQSTGAFEEWLAEQNAEVDVQVNPRFGEWNPEQGAVVSEGAEQSPATGPSAPPTE